MRRYFCDRCGAEMPDIHKRHNLRSRLVYKRIIMFVPVGGDWQIENDKEICEDCMNSFYHWWDNYDEEGDS